MVMGCMFLAAVLLLSMASKAAIATPIPTSDDSFEKTGGFDSGYLFSFAFDECGESSIGKVFREAIIAKVDSCPFPPKVKADFYRDAALLTNQALVGYAAIAFTTPHKPYVPRKDAHCENLKKPNIMTLRERIAQYDAGKLKLADVLVNDSGGPLGCEEGAKGGFETRPGSSSPER